jgi:hypothetical protein
MKLRAKPVFFITEKEKAELILKSIQDHIPV